MCVQKACMQLCYSMLDLSCCVLTVGLYMYKRMYRMHGCRCVFMGDVFDLCRVYYVYCMLMPGINKVSLLLYVLIN